MKYIDTNMEHPNNTFFIQIILMMKYNIQTLSHGTMLDRILTLSRFWVINLRAGTAVVEIKQQFV